MFPQPEISQKNSLYSITYCGVEGRGGVALQEVSKFKKPTPNQTNDVCNFCERNGIGIDARVLIIKTFYPNGSPQKGIGAGTHLLNAMMEDARENQASLIYVLATTDKMEAFLRRKGFEECRKFRRQFYKILG